MLIAGIVRFYQLGAMSAGLFRDEAFNGLDALGILEGEHALFFPTNNGREPLYIYLTAVSLSIWGRSALAIRFAAAVAGALATWFVYRLGKAWFGEVAGIFAAWIWGVTVWSVHLSRIGFRVILLPCLMSAALLMATHAYRKRDHKLWLAAGFLYGAAFYSYLAVRLTPIFLLAWGTGLFARQRLRRHERAGAPDWLPGAFTFALGTTVAVAPLLSALAQMPATFGDRSTQVSIFNPAINGGDFWGTLGRHIWAALAMFFWRGDTILRHNPSGRPIFDPVLAIFMLIGLAWLLRHWRKPAALGVLLWVGIMGWGTILAEDAPHFLRGAGMLPGIYFLPAIGLAQFWRWEKLPSFWRHALVLIGLAVSLAWGIRDYTAYARHPETGYAFESVIRELGEQINQDAAVGEVWIQDILWNDRPTLDFLVGNRDDVSRFNDMPAAIAPPATMFVWPHQPQDEFWRVFPQAGQLSAQLSSLGRGDLEPDPYPFYLRYQFAPPTAGESAAIFGDGIELLMATTAAPNGSQLEIETLWRAKAPTPRPLTLFVHLLDGDIIVAQEDGMPGDGFLPTTIWQPGWIVAERVVISLETPYDARKNRLEIGWYESTSGRRLPAFDPSGNLVGDVYSLPHP